jgi:hypothetical protein
MKLPFAGLIAVDSICEYPNMLEFSSSFSHIAAWTRAYLLSRHENKFERCLGGTAELLESGFEEHLAEARLTSFHAEPQSNLFTLAIIAAPPISLTSLPMNSCSFAPFISRS